MPYRSSQDLTIERSSNNIKITSPFWSLVHDVNRGGALTNLRFANGKLGEILVEPFGIILDDLSDLSSRDTKVSITESKNGIELLFEGFLNNSVGRPSPVSFGTRYSYTPYFMRREVRLKLPAACKAKRLSPLSVRLVSALTHWSAAHDTVTKPGRAERILGPHYEQEDGEVPSVGGLIFQDARPAGWVSAYLPGAEGIQIAPTGDLSHWDAPGGIVGLGDYRLMLEHGGLSMHLDALSAIEPMSLLSELVFAAFITFVNLDGTERTPLRTVMVGNPPFPADEQLKTWADSGVQLITIMEGAGWGTIQKGSDGPSNTEVTGWTHGTDRFWRMGNYPCYREKHDMDDLDRLIRSSHHYGMSIIAYTCPTELHPEVPSFAENVHEWHQSAIPGGGAIYHPAGKSAGGCYGALMCPDSTSWRRHYLAYVNTLLMNHHFDGIYVDNVWKNTCYNMRHGPPHHSGLDGMWTLLKDLRDHLGSQKLLVIHNGEQNFLATTNNLADMIVTLEGIAWLKHFRYDLRAIYRTVRAFPACAVSIVPCSTWYRVPGSLPPQTGLRDGIAKALLLGAIPYSYAWWETAWGYHNWREAIEDPRGLYEAFRKLRSLKLEGLKFEDCFNTSVHTNHQLVKGARYYGNGRQVVIIVNVSEHDQEEIHWQSGGIAGSIDHLPADEYRFIETVA